MCLGKTYLFRPLSWRFDFDPTTATAADTRVVYLRDETADLRGPLAPEVNMAVSGPGKILLTRPRTTSTGGRVLVNGAAPRWQPNPDNGGGSMVASINEGDCLTLGIAATFIVASSANNRGRSRLSLGVIWRDACLQLLTAPLPPGLSAPTAVEVQGAESGWEAAAGGSDDDGLFCPFVRPIALRLPMVRGVLLPITSSYHRVQSDVLAGTSRDGAVDVGEDAEHVQTESACAFLIAAAIAMELSLAACSLLDEPRIHTSLSLSFGSATLGQDPSSSTRFNIARALQFRVELLTGPLSPNQNRAHGNVARPHATGSVLQLTHKLSLVLALMHRVQSAQVARLRHQFLQDLAPDHHRELVASAPEWWLRHDSVFVPSTAQRLQDLLQQLGLQ